MPTADLTLAFVAKLVAKPGLEDEVGGVPGRCRRPGQRRGGTVVWFALRTDASTFWIVDAFPHEEARQAHITTPSPRR